METSYRQVFLPIITMSSGRRLETELETVTLSFVIIRRYNALDYTVVANCGILFVPMIIRLRMFMHVHTSMNINKKTEFR